MPFLGSTPADKYQSLAKQTITGDGSTAYTLNRSVTNAYDMEVFINNVRQEPDTSYTASGNTITFTAAVTASDSCYLIYQGQSVGSINPPANSVGSSQVANNTITTAHLHTGLNIATSKLTGDIPYANMPAGSVLQVLQALKTDTFSTTSGTFVQVPDLTVTITPSSASNKILITGCISLSASQYAWHCGLFQDGTEIGLADVAGNRPRSLFGGMADDTTQQTHGLITAVPRELLVSPNTTSAITFDIRAARRYDNETSPTTYINRSAPDRNTSTYDQRCISTLTVREIAG
jgi:hypothetical protein